MKFYLLSHAGEENTEAVVSSSSGFLYTFTHQSAPLSLLLIAFILFVLFTAMRIMKVIFLNRVLVLIPTLIAFAVFYLPHNAMVTTVVLSIGFILTFLLVFTMLAGKPQ